MIECWRQIPPPFSRYEASDLGRVRNAETGRILSIQKCSDGAPGFSLYRDDNNKATMVRCGITVWRAFYGEPRFRHYVIHLNGDMANSSLDNLKLVSYSEYRKAWYDEYNAQMDALYEETVSEFDDYIFGSCTESEAERRSRRG